MRAHRVHTSTTRFEILKLGLAGIYTAFSTDDLSLGPFGLRSRGMPAMFAHTLSPLAKFLLWSRPRTILNDKVLRYGKQSEYSESISLYYFTSSSIKCSFKTCSGWHIFLEHIYYRHINLLRPIGYICEPSLKRAECANRFTLEDEHGEKSIYECKTWGLRRLSGKLLV